MDTAARFSALNRFANTLGSLFDCRLVMFLLMEEDLGRKFSTSEIGNIFACISRTKTAMDNRRPQPDSEHQIGPGMPFHRVLTVVGTWYTGGRNKSGRKFYLRNLGRFCLYLRNHRRYGQTEPRERFSASNRSRNTHPRNSNGSCGLLHRR